MRWKVKNIGALHRSEIHCRLTRVVKEGVHKGAVFKEGANRGDIFKVTVEERRVDECDGLELHTDEPERRRETEITEDGGNKPLKNRISRDRKHVSDSKGDHSETYRAERNKKDESHKAESVKTCFSFMHFNSNKH